MPNSKGPNKWYILKDWSVRKKKSREKKNLKFPIRHQSAEQKSKNFFVKRKRNFTLLTRISSFVVFFVLGAFGAVLLSTPHFRDPTWSSDVQFATEKASLWKVHLPLFLSLLFALGQFICRKLSFRVDGELWRLHAQKNKKDFDPSKKMAHKLC